MRRDGTIFIKGEAFGKNYFIYSTWESVTLSQFRDICIAIVREYMELKELKTIFPNHATYACHKVVLSDGKNLKNHFVARIN